ncbi:hypothetical protein ADILRU_2326 [Leifsonia rubra CMS 76R]|nr:hypothetical protein ADILRU_2326 [Leifsonia rubra CMS 76R]
MTTDKCGASNPRDDVDAYRFWLEHELKFAPSRESWLGFDFLGGIPTEAAKVRRLLKLDSSIGELSDRVWGASWDLFYTRMVRLVAQAPYKRVVPNPLVFVTDDSGLAAAMDTQSNLSAPCSR